MRRSGAFPATGVAAAGSWALATGLTQIHTLRPIAYNPHNNPEFGVIVVPTLKMRKRRLREVK